LTPGQPVVDKNDRLWQFPLLQTMVMSPIFDQLTRERLKTGTLKCFSESFGF